MIFSPFWRNRLYLSFPFTFSAFVDLTDVFAQVFVGRRSFPVLGIVIIRDISPWSSPFTPPHAHLFGLAPGFVGF